LIGAKPREVAIDQVSRSGFSHVSIDRVRAFPTAYACDLELTHEAFHRAAGDVVALSP